MILPAALILALTTFKGCDGGVFSIDFDSSCCPLIAACFITVNCFLGLNFLARASLTVILLFEECYELLVGVSSGRWF